MIRPVSCSPKQNEIKRMRSLLLHGKRCNGNFKSKTTGHMISMYTDAFDPHIDGCDNDSSYTSSLRLERERSRMIIEDLESIIRHKNMQLTNHSNYVLNDTTLRSNHISKLPSLSFVGDSYLDTHNQPSSQYHNKHRFDDMNEDSYISSSILNTYFRSIFELLSKFSNATLSTINVMLFILFVDLFLLLLLLVGEYWLSGCARSS